MIGERIRLARRARGLTMRELGELAGVTHAAIGKMEAGHSVPTDENLGAIAQATGRRLDFFRRPVRALPAPLYRKRASLGKKRMEVIESVATVYVEAFIDACLAAGVDVPVRIPECPRDDLEAAARVARQALGLPVDGPCDHVLSALEQAGAVVVRLADMPESFDGFSSFWGARPVVVIDRGVDGVGDRCRWTAVHELGHLVLHRHGGPELKQADKEADRFASAFLLPREAISEDFSRTTLTPIGLAPLKAKWRVSIQALVMRAHDLGFLSAYGKERAFKEIGSRGWRKREPVDIPQEKPVLFTRLLKKLRESRGLASLGRVCVGLNDREIGAMLGFRLGEDVVEPEDS